MAKVPWLKEYVQCAYKLLFLSVTHGKNLSWDVSDSNGYYVRSRCSLFCKLVHVDLGLSTVVGLRWACEFLRH